MPERTPTVSLQRMIDGYLSGGTGIHFDALARFAEPLFDLYELDPRAGLDQGKEARTNSELALLLAVLETTRLFWAYFSLDAETADRFLPELEAKLIGDHASDAERLDFLELIRIMAEQWNAFDPEERIEAIVPGYPIPGFESLLNEYGPLHSSDAVVAVASRYGPDKLDLPEALALFARPLLDDPQVIEDPDTLEETLERVNAYWDLAQVEAPEYEEQLKLIKKTFARSKEDAARIEREAGFMIDRFYMLFPEQKHPGT